MRTDALQQILGKTVKGVVVKEPLGDWHSVACQFYIVFTDDTCLELYSSDGPISFPASIDRGGLDEARRYLSGSLKVIYEAELGENGGIVEDGLYALKDSPHSAVSLARMG